MYSLTSFMLLIAITQKNILYMNEPFVCFLPTIYNINGVRDTKQKTFLKTANINEREGIS